MVTIINTVLMVFALIMSMLVVTAVLVLMGCFIEAIVERNEERGHRK